MSSIDERRQAIRRAAEATGKITLGAEGDVACRVIDVSESGAQVRVDGRRATRNLVGKRISLAIDGAAGGLGATSYAGHIVWARPAVNGVYLGLAFAGARDGRPSPTPTPES
jgi:hypothetical protein